MGPHANRFGTPVLLFSILYEFWRFLNLAFLDLFCAFFAVVRELLLELATARNPAINLILKGNIAMLFIKKIPTLQLMFFLARPGTCCSKRYTIYLKPSLGAPKIVD